MSVSLTIEAELPWSPPNDGGMAVGNLCWCLIFYEHLCTDVPENLRSISARIFLHWDTILGIVVPLQRNWATRCKKNTLS